MPYKDKAKANLFWSRREKDPKRIAYRTAWRKRQHRLQSRKYSLKTVYGLTLDDYDNLLKQQNGGCALCGSPPKPHKNDKLGDLAVLCVDHNHTTGKVRGLLCGRCNTGIGLLRDDPLFLIKVIEYLKRGST